ncbi:MAG: DNA methylase [Candidatus Fluviicola riflensis]|nr:MAG: alpha-ketoglutarate-dependent dioxygenase AlkB [Candidatus Fluviicola riflensis]OGS79405.1 MAG: DNA methylase [Candidatus Fluviicola riflensis]OGS86837.1 MAG: DNA methylase [Fluviicola sp. RIFCSPHIGHO2_01_FULL_43_53]OGS89627.1 MAG: DNA methylase [Fluviicola sp. RIFCSPHIGHO2_12_FULL_43_24]
MNLFSNGTVENKLPKDGTVFYYGILMSIQQADHYLERLLNTIEWKNDEAVIFGKHIITKRKVAWYGNDSYSYTYSNTTKTALPWTQELMELKQLAEATTGATYNSCLLNLYHDGSEGMAWHSDDEKMLNRHGSIASLSFGAERKFAFKHKKDQQIVSLVLEHGSLLEMKDETQTHWLHRLPPTTRVKRPRVNLTFRQMLV